MKQEATASESTLHMFVVGEATLTPKYLSSTFLKTCNNNNKIMSMGLR